MTRRSLFASLFAAPVAVTAAIVATEPDPMLGVVGYSRPVKPMTPWIMAVVGDANHTQIELHVQPSFRRVTYGGVELPELSLSNEGGGYGWTKTGTDSIIQLHLPFWDGNTRDADIQVFYGGFGGSPLRMVGAWRTLQSGASTHYALSPAAL